MDPRARIEAFLADYAAAHAEVKPLFDNKEKGTSLAAFDAWREKLREIDVAHRNGEFYRRYALSFSSSPDFSPDTLEIGTFPHGSYLAVGDPYGEMSPCALKVDPGVARAQAYWGLDEDDRSVQLWSTTRSSGRPPTLPRSRSGPDPCGVGPRPRPGEWPCYVPGTDS